MVLGYTNQSVTQSRKAQMKTNGINSLEKSVVNKSGVADVSRTCEIRP